MTDGKRGKGDDFKCCQGGERLDGLLFKFKSISTLLGPRHLLSSSLEGNTEGSQLECA